MARVALRRTFLVSAAKVSISILLLSIFLFRADISGIVATVCKVSFITILKIGGLVTAINLLWALKWNILIPDIPFGKVLSLTVSAQYYSIILPGQLSGEVMKVYRMGKDGGDTGLLAASVVIDKLSSLLALLLCALVGLLLSSNAPAVIWIVVVGCILILGVLMLSGMFQRTSNISNNLLMLLPLPGKWRSTLYHWGARYFHAWSGYLRRRQELVRNLILSGITQLLGIFLIDVLATDLDIVIAFTDWCWIYGLMSIAVLLPLSIGGIGIRDGSLIGLLSYMGISADRSLALSLLLFFFMFIVAVAGGGVEIIRIIQMRTDGSS